MPNARRGGGQQIEVFPELDEFSVADLAIAIRAKDHFRGRAPGAFFGAASIGSAALGATSSPTALSMEAVQSEPMVAPRCRRSPSFAAETWCSSIETGLVFSRIRFAVAISSRVPCATTTK